MPITISSLEALSTFALRLAEVLKLAKEDYPGTVLLLYGDMGAGKTALVSALEAHLSNGHDVSSPTFALINHYDWDGLQVRHLDLYRLESQSAVESIDLESVYDVACNGGLVIIEWAERLTTEQKPLSFLELHIKRDGDTRVFSWSAYPNDLEQSEILLKLNTFK